MPSRRRIRAPIDKYKIIFKLTSSVDLTITMGYLTMKKIFLIICAWLSAISTLSAILPGLPHTTDMATLKQMFEKKKEDIAPKLEQLKALVDQYHMQDVFAEDFGHIKLYLSFNDQSNGTHDDLIKKYQLAIGMLQWYSLQVSAWLHALQRDGQDFYISYLK